MQINAPGSTRGNVTTSIATAFRGAILGARTQHKSTFAEKLGKFQTNIASVGSVIPGGSVLSAAINSALGGVFGEIDEGVAEAEQQIKSTPELSRNTQILADIAAVRRQLKSIKTRLETGR